MNKKLIVSKPPEYTKTSDILKKYKRDQKINEVLFEEGVEVLLPFDDEGVIMRIETKTLNFFPYEVKIIKTNGLFSELGEIKVFKSDDLELKNKI
jgi:hypothetical protein